jgi:hypothetical protein
MNETENNQPVAEPTTARVETVEKRKTPIVGFTAAILVAVVIIVGVLYVLEKEGRSSTTLFSSIIGSQQVGAVVAAVNGEEITAGKLSSSIQQFNQVAVSQGIDITNPEAQQNIRSQALDVLINTTLMKQAARDRGITVSEDDVSARIGVIREDLGGEEVLAERMEVLGIGQEQLVSDINDELLIERLLEQIFSETDVAVSDEEVVAVYEGAGGAEAGLPPLEDVRGEIEAQIVSTKEQGAIDGYLTALREGASIEIK